MSDFEHDASEFDRFDPEDLPHDDQVVYADERPEDLDDTDEPIGDEDGELPAE